MFFTTAPINPKHVYRDQISNKSPNLLFKHSVFKIIHGKILQELWDKLPPIFDHRVIEEEHVRESSQQTADLPGNIVPQME
jgi:hypothetical protein